MQTSVDLDSLKDRYDIITELGQGGMSVVWKARDKTLDRLVALKTLSVRNLSEKQLVQFQAEARALSGLKHKGIMEILDFGITRTGKPYMVLEYIEGIPLSKYIENVGPLPLISCLSIFSELCEALNHAHNKGVLHRDIKPSNVILVSASKGNYTPKIIDFGLAVLGDSQTATDAEIETAGSPPYMSPEQIEGKDLDQRTDIYSLGCTLFEALCGKLPYEGATAFETMNLHKTAPIPAIGKVCEDPNINSSLQNCVKKTLSKNKNDRYQYVIALQKVLEELKIEALESARIKKQDLDLDQVEVKTKKKIPVVWIYSGLLSFALLGLGYFLFSYEYAKRAKKDDRVQTEAIKNSDKRRQYSDAEMNYAVHQHENPNQITQKLIDKIPSNDVEVSFREDAITDADFSTLSRMKNLKKLLLSSSGVSPKNIEQISHLVSLESLFLQNNVKIANADFSSFSKLKNLKQIDLEACNLTKKALLPITQIKTLRELGIGAETGLDKEIINNLQKLPNLVQLDIGFNGNMDIESKKAIGNFPKVKVLALDGLLLDDDTTEIISKKLNGVEELSFTHNLITLSGLEALLKIPTLRSINVNACDQVLNDESEEALSDLSRKYKTVKIVDKSRFLKYKSKDDE
ncbi:protein kinase [bacterium]|nr:protein kinase [bacterium]